MKFIVESISKCSGRLGLITNIERLPDRTYKTPLLLFLFPNISREVLELSSFDLINDFGVLLPVNSIEQMEKPLKAYQKGVSEFIGLKECLTMITLKNSAEVSVTGHHERGSIPIFRKSNKINMTPERYMSIIEACKADIYSSLADGDTYLGCSNKRIVKSLDRSESMFDSCMEICNKQNISTPLVATVEGAFNEFDRKRCIEHLKQDEEKVFGFFLDGFHRNGHEAIVIDHEAFKKIVKSTISYLPDEKIKFMFGSYLPHVTLELIMMGVDVLDSSLVNILTNLNRAMVFNFDVDNPIKKFPEIDLMDSVYKDDFSPFSEYCECHACKNHTKAYTNHLLKTRELLGPMLLTIHNLHYYKKFFEAIRECIKNDRLSELFDLINDQYKNANLNYETTADEESRGGSFKRKLID